MKKLLAMLMAMTFAITAMAVPVSAAKPTRPGEANSDREVGFYVSRWGTQFDEEGNIESRDVAHFSSKVYQAELKKPLENNFAIALGKNVEEKDILDYVKKEPKDDQVFKALEDEFKDVGAKIYTATGKEISWDDLTDKNYEVLWYVLKKENDHWHIDGVVIDKDTGEEIIIVPPEEEDDEDLPISTPEPTDPEPDEPTPTEPPEDESIVLEGVEYAYIFGYEPDITYVIDENGERKATAKIKMAMDDYVTVEQVSSMLMRLLDQTGKTQDVQYPMVPAVEPHAGQWYERGLLYLCSVGGFDVNKVITLGPITRGHVAKLVSCALKLNLSKETPFTDIDGEYKEYIEKVYAYGYMKGQSATEFGIDEVMTRAEFCKLFNNIIGRDAFGLIALDENGDEFEVTHETYYFVDMNPSHWAYETCLKATSAYDENGYVDIVTRNSNIRNILDQYDAQKIY